MQTDKIVHFGKYQCKLKQFKKKELKIFDNQFFQYLTIPTQVPNKAFQTKSAEHHLSIAGGAIKQKMPKYNYGTFYLVLFSCPGGRGIETLE